MSLAFNMIRYYFYELPGPPAASGGPAGQLGDPRVSGVMTSIAASNSRISELPWLQLCYSVTNALLNDLDPLPADIV
jgi:hypothetical protein